jgi:hypothetical protein
MIRILRPCCYSLQAAPIDVGIAAMKSNAGRQNMNTKKLAIFGTSAVVLAGILVYALGIYPPASGRDGRGAIGQRDVYRADQPADASVNPNDAPVANADELKSGEIVTLQNGQMFQLNNGLKYQLQDSKMVPLKDGFTYRLADGQMVQFRNGALYAQMNGQFSHELNADRFVQRFSIGQVVAVNGLTYRLSSGQMLALRNEMRDQMQNGMARQ